MTDSLNFDIKPIGPISKTFLEHRISSFVEATQFVRQLRYGRNKDKDNLATVFTDNCGTCSTKHALLKQLANEHQFFELKLMMGMFKMNSMNTPKISSILNKYKLDYIPEAHNYLKYRDARLDFTHTTSQPTDFENEFMEEIEIQPNQISVFKINYHKQYLSKWLNKEDALTLTVEELWYIREECIAELSGR